MPAIEIVDIDRPFDDLTAILANNVFHRGVVIGSSAGTSSLSTVDRIEARVIRNHQREAAFEGAQASEFVETVRLVASLLGRFGERLCAGDVIIAGSLTPIVWVEPGDRVDVSVRPLGRLDVSFRA
jgi:2-keto-4-pentenoate hydratase